MAESPAIDPRTLSQRELEDYLDRLVLSGEDDTPALHRAYDIWEANQ